ncbi:MAG: thioesterase family protein [Marivibrio sp.]|uniref:thioesterase family protein n=1 Tax=Marivibrio sp. TaxID=2039719 RepID=UPI0032EEB75C
MPAPEFDPALVQGWREEVREEWIDYNGHMNVAYYVLAFDHATDHFTDGIGLDAAYRAGANASFFVVDMNVTYKRELRGGAPLVFATQLLGFDSKRIRFFHMMHHAEEGFLAATNEILTVHVDMTARRSAPMPESVLANLRDLSDRQAPLPTPEGAGRVIGLRR